MRISRILDPKYGMLHTQVYNILSSYVMPLSVLLDTEIDSIRRKKKLDLSFQSHSVEIEDISITIIFYFAKIPWNQSI